MQAQLGSLQIKYNDSIIEAIRWEVKAQVLYCCLKDFIEIQF